MKESRPRDLTANDLALLQAPSVFVGQSVPARVPPGARVSIEDLGVNLPSEAELAAPTELPPTLMQPTAAGPLPSKANAV